MYHNPVSDQLEIFLVFFHYLFFLTINPVPIACLDLHLFIHFSLLIFLNLLFKNLLFHFQIVQIILIMQFLYHLLILITFYSFFPNFCQETLNLFFHLFFQIMQFALIFQFQTEVYHPSILITFYFFFPNFCQQILNLFFHLFLQVQNQVLNQIVSFALIFNLTQFPLIMQLPK